MQIAQIAPLMEAVPPKLYGGTERIVAYLTDELVTMGHEVTLFASGDSVDDGDPRTGLRTERFDSIRRSATASRPLLAMLEKGRAARPRLRCRSPPLRLSRLSGVAASRSTVPRHSARPPGSARTEAALSCVFRRAGGLDIQLPARAVARGGVSLPRCIMVCPNGCCSPEVGVAGIWLFSAVFRRRRRRTWRSA